MTGDSVFIYKFKSKYPALFTIGGLAGLFVIFAISIGIKDRAPGGVVFCLCFAGAAIFIGKIFLYGKLNIRLTDESVARTLLGREVQVIKWVDVEKVKVFPLRAIGMKSEVMGYNIDAKSSTSRTRRIYFGDQNVDLSPLLLELNVYIKRHDIIVDRVIGGVATTCKSL